MLHPGRRGPRGDGRAVLIEVTWPTRESQTSAHRYTHTQALGAREEPACALWWPTPHPTVTPDYRRQDTACGTGGGVLGASLFRFLLPVILQLFQKKKLKKKKRKKLPGKAGLGVSVGVKGKR